MWQINSYRRLGNFATGFPKRAYEFLLQKKKLIMNLR